MKYIVGYSIQRDSRFVDDIIRFKDSISEVYFSFGDFASGRKSLTDDGDGTLFEKQLAMDGDLKRLYENGIKFNLLFNANCYGKDSQSRAFYHKIGSTVELVRSRYGLSSVTVASPLIAKFIRSNFEGIDVRASVNMEIGSIEGVSYVESFFDSFYIKRELNRDMKELLRIKEYCDSIGKSIYLLANSGCLKNCSAHIFHDNLVAHEAEISVMDNGYEFGGVCRDYLLTKDGLSHWLERTTFIRPEDVELYRGITSAMKLATRINPNPSRILSAYTKKNYGGSAMELLEPDHSGLIYPRYVDNSRIPSDHVKEMLECDKRCDACGKCRRIMREATVTLGPDTSLKV